MLNAPLHFQQLELDFQTLELDFQTLNLDNLAHVHDTLPRAQRLDDNLNFNRSPPPTNLLLFAFLSQNMPADRTIAPEINIFNNWHIIPTSGDLLANDTNDLAHFLSLHPFGSWPPKAPPRLNLQVTSSPMTFLVPFTACDLILSINFLVMVVFFTSKGCELTLKAMLNDWFSSGIFAALLHILFLHDLYPLPEMFWTRLFWTILEVRIRKVLPHGMTHLSSELRTHRWYPAYVFLYIYFYSTYFSLTFTLNNVCVSSSEISAVISALVVISYASARQSPCPSRCLYSTHFFSICTLQRVVDVIECEFLR